MKCFERRLLLADVKLLEDEGCEDNTLATLGADHAARAEALLKAVQCPSYARALALELAKGFLRVAEEIDENSYQEPELINVG